MAYSSGPPLTDFARRLMKVTSKRAKYMMLTTISACQKQGLNAVNSATAFCHRLKLTTSGRSWMGASSVLDRGLSSAAGGRLLLLLLEDGMLEAALGGGGRLVVTKGVAVTSLETEGERMGSGVSAGGVMRVGSLAAGLGPKSSSLKFCDGGSWRCKGRVLRR